MNIYRLLGLGLVGFAGVAASVANAANVAVGRDQSLEFGDSAIVRVEVLASENVSPGDPNALVVGFSGQGACLVYVFEDNATLNQEVRLALFDGNDNILGLPIVTIDNSYYSSVDPACGSVEVPDANSVPLAADDNFGENYAGQNVLANDSDADGDSLTAVLAGNTQNGSLVLNGNGTFSYTPNEGFAGTDSFTYRASDGAAQSNLATVTLTVAEPENRAPQAVADDFGTDFAGRNVLANDSDPDGDSLTAILVSSPGNGSLQLNADGSFAYTQNTGYTGPDSFSYRASDGELQSAVATVSLRVAAPGPGTPPIAVDDELGGDYAGGNLLNNDLYADRDQLVAVKVTDPEGGELELNADGSFVYQPFAGFSGTDSFTYLVRAPDGLESNAATVTLSVDADEAGEDGVTGKKDADGTSVLEDATRNELRLSRRIDRICTRLEPGDDAQRDLLDLCSSLRQQGTTAEQALAALKAITPEELAAIGKAVRVLSFSRFRSIGGRMSRVREGSRGVSLAGLNLNYGNSTVSGRELESMLEESLGALGMGASGDEMLAGSRLGLFVRGDLSFGDQDTTGLESGFDFDAQTLTVGADYRLTDNAFVGTSVSLGQAEVKFERDSGETRTDNYALAFYGSLYSGNGYVDGIFSYGWSDIETERNIVYQDFASTVDRVATGSSDGTEYYISVNAGYTWSRGSLKLDPLLRFFYLDGEVDGFTETGAQGLDLTVGKQKVESMSMTASGQVSYTFLPSWGVITPYLRLEYTRELEDSAEGVRYRFANDPFGDELAEEILQIEVDDPDTTYMVYGAGVAAQFAHGLSGYVSYQALGSYEGLSGEIVSFGMRWETSF